MLNRLKKLVKTQKTRKLYEMLLKSETSENNLRKALQSTNDALDAQGNKALTTAEKLKRSKKQPKSEISWRKALGWCNGTSCGDGCCGR